MPEDEAQAARAAGLELLTKRYGEELDEPHNHPPLEWPQRASSPHQFAAIHTFVQQEATAEPVQTPSDDDAQPA